MVVSNALGRILKVWGGYTPKLYDSEFLKITREEFQALFQGDVVIGGNHFSGGKSLFHNIKFHTSIAESGLGKRKKKGKTKEKISKEDKAFNMDHQKARARVELICPHQKPLGKPSASLASDEEQLGHLFRIVAALHNARLLE